MNAKKISRFFRVSGIAVRATSISLFLTGIAVLLVACDCNRSPAVEGAGGGYVVPKVELTAHKSQKFEANQFIANFSVELRDPDKDGAYKKLAERRTRIFETVKSLEIAESNIEQNSVSLTKEWSYRDGGRKLTGYCATQHFQVKLDSRRDAAALSELLASQPDVEIYPTQTTLAAQDSLQGVMIEAAVREGLAKASHYAAGAGLKVGRVLYMNDMGSNVMPMGMHRYKAMAFASNGMDGSAPDESAIADSVEISVNVQLGVELK